MKNKTYYSVADEECVPRFFKTRKQADKFAAKMHKAMPGTDIEIVRTKDDLCNDASYVNGEIICTISATVQKEPSKKELEQLLELAFTIGTAVGASSFGNLLNEDVVEADIEEDGSVRFTLEGDGITLGIDKNTKGEFLIVDVNQGGL